ncbi:hypothetical protein RFI_00312 [Reticulomyxa filosa]|uniref:Uncharacterized protein n=1 Tax=Reticulomyxa filosa TaxID=46433 RepID=X6PE10_RETFI|nr:hypothetical protein RFI_00312 [Reticulomyxa filosa]|eukprot:ETO36750.1 hypothetical protein RFI_00312 [Reticulomyxa filosa]
MFITGVKHEDLECYVEEICIQHYDHSITLLIHLMYLVMNRVGWKSLVLIKRNLRHQALISHYVHLIFFQFASNWKQLQRKLLFEKQQHMALNINKICIIPALVNKETNSVARSDADKAYLLAKTFAEPSQPPKDMDEKHYEIVKKDIRFKVAISKPLKLDENDVIESLRYLPPYKAQDPDNIHNQMLKNGNVMIDSLVFLFANIVPIPKPDRDHSQCNNHRPIALLSSVGKLIESLQGD